MIQRILTNLSKRQNWGLTNCKTGCILVSETKNSLKENSELAKGANNMGKTFVKFEESEAQAVVTEDGVILEPQDRVRGFGVALKLSEARQFARMILELEEMLELEPIGGDAAHPLA